MESQVIYEFSEEVYSLDAGAEWIIHEETVGTDPDSNQAEAHVRRLGANPSAIQLQHINAVCSEAWNNSNDNLCCPRQIASILEINIADVCSIFDEIEHDWLSKGGATPEMLIEFCNKKKLGCVILHNEEPLFPAQQGYPIIACAIVENHAYFYADQRVCKSLLKRALTTKSKAKLKHCIIKSKEAPEFEPWSYEIKPGQYYTTCPDELLEIRRWFATQNKFPKMLLKDLYQPRALSYQCVKHLDNAKGACVIHLLHEQWDEIKQWAEHFGLQYHGEGLPNISFKVMQHLIKKKTMRTPLSGIEKNEILQEYGHKCAQCGSRSNKLEFDHICRVSESYGAAPECQPLCPACHREKTDLEARNLDSSIGLASTFEKHAWENYVLSERMPPLLYKHHECKEAAEQLRIVDVIRCRRRSLEYNNHCIPIYCSLDQIQPRIECILGDLNFVTKRPTNIVSQLSYTGAGWIHKSFAEFLLHMGVIAWCDISHILMPQDNYQLRYSTSPLSKWMKRGLKLGLI